MQAGSLIFMIIKGDLESMLALRGEKGEVEFRNAESSLVTSRTGGNGFN